MWIYKCLVCGREFFTDLTVSDARCPFCGHSMELIAFEDYLNGIGLTASDGTIDLIDIYDDP